MDDAVPKTVASLSTSLFNVVWEEETVLPLWPQREGPALSSVGGIVSSPHNIKENCQSEWTIFIRGSRSCGRGGCRVECALCRASQCGPRGRHRSRRRA